MGKVDSAALLNKINEQLARLGATGVPRLPKHHNRITRDEHRAAHSRRCRYHGRCDPRCCMAGRFAGFW